MKSRLIIAALMVLASTSMGLSDDITGQASVIDGDTLEIHGTRNGYSAMPDFVEPPIGPVARPDLAASFPLILTCAKPSLFCQTQHRALPSLRKRALHPEIELN